MENARSDIASRILLRMAHKRDDFAQFYANLSPEQSAELIITLKQFLSDIVKNVGNLEKVCHYKLLLAIWINVICSTMPLKR